MKHTIRTKRLFVNLTMIAFIFSIAAAQNSAAPPPSSTFTVDRTDDATVSTCTAAANDCTLRGAIAKAGVDGLPSMIVFNIPANSAGCNSTACTITVTGQLSPLADAGRLTTIDGGAASANTITLSGGGAANSILFIDDAVKVSVNNLIFTAGDRAILINTTAR